MIKMVSSYILALICILSSVTLSKSHADLSTLRFVQSVFRHGDRTPAVLIATDTNNTEDTWPNGLNALTTLGMQQMYELGQFLKRRYAGFLNETYQKSEIFMVSSDKDRTIMSAQAKLAGMYPPKGEEIWNQNLLWQPIPVHVLSKRDSYILHMNGECPTLKALYDNKVHKQAEYLKHESENSEFLKFLAEKAGRDQMTLNDMWDIYDPLNCEMFHNATHAWPNWANQTIFDKITELFYLSTIFYYNLPEVQRLRGASLFHEIAWRMKKKTENQSKLKYFAYSAHDTAIIALLSNIGVYDGNNAEYAEILLFEMHERQPGQYFVEIYKRNTTTDQLYNITIPGCSPCPVDQFVTMAKKNVPKDWYDECGFDAVEEKSAVKGISKEAITISEELLAILLVVCLILAASLATYIFMYRKLASSVGPKRIQF